MKSKENSIKDFTFALDDVDSSGASVFVSGHLYNGTGPKVGNGLVVC